MKHSQSQRALPIMTAQKAAALIDHGATLGFSAFTPAGAAKLVPRALAKRAREHHAQGRPFQVRVLTGASTGTGVDDELIEANAISWRAPYQSSHALRKQINAQKIQFLDMHLSMVPQALEFGFIPKLDFAIVEATDVLADGRVYLTTSVGISPSALRHAERVIVEVNRHHSHRLSEMHDIAVLPTPPYRSPIPIFHPLSKMGTPFATVDPKKIVAVVENDEPDGVDPFTAPDEASRGIAAHVVRFLAEELHAGRIPPEFLPLQSGVGNIANAVMSALGASEDIPRFYMYSEVFQDALVDLMLSGRLLGASTTSLTLSEPQLQRLYENMDFFAPRLVLRPQELSNNPGVVRRLGVIAINTVLEMDIFGNANSTHVCGTYLMNGVGGSGDFVRNGYLSILVAPSTAKGGRLSTVVPMVTHVDHNEHSVQVLVTEYGLADLRGLGPVQRAHTIIEKCAHPFYREYLGKYLADAPVGHIPHDLKHCFDLHRNFLATGSMLPEPAPPGNTASDPDASNSKS